MYAITTDYFNSFTATFGPKECELNGKAYPLGHFAAEALEMDESLLRDLEDAVARFKPELEVFLSARTVSSGAVVQQRANEVWTILRRLPDSLHNFVRNTFLLVENCFERLPSRSPETYAIAYNDYRNTIRAAYDDEDDEIRRDLESIRLSFPVRLGFRAMNTKKRGAVLGEEFTFEELTSFLYTDLYKGIAAGNVPRRCHNYRHFFLVVGGYDTVYCNRIAPGETKRTCRQVGAHRKEKAVLHPEITKRKMQKNKIPPVGMVPIGGILEQRHFGNLMDAALNPYAKILHIKLIGGG